MIPEQYLDSEDFESPKTKNKNRAREKALRSGWGKAKVTHKTPDLGFHFSQSELSRIALAGHKAARFMKTYGAGQKPYMVDLSHYENSYGKGKTNKG